MKEETSPSVAPPCYSNDFHFHLPVFRTALPGAQDLKGEFPGGISDSAFTDSLGPAHLWVEVCCGQNKGKHPAQ